MHSEAITPPIRSNAAPARIEAVRADRRTFDAFIEQREFPCLGAKAALAQQHLQVLRVHDIASTRDDQQITDALQAFAGQTDEHSLFVSMAVMFPDSASLSEPDFEAALWRRLRAIHAIDHADHAWDGSVSDDPASPQFSMSIGGKAFYVVGLHPGASRRARRFRCPAMVFNLHSQFEQLRADGRYPKLRAAIIARDVAFSGSPNAMLAVHGKSSEARQYSGRLVSSAWACPFRAEAPGDDA